MNVSQRFARGATATVARAPWLWPLFRGRFRQMFDALAPEWDARRTPDRLTAFLAALDALPAPPRRALDVGTGTGDAAFAIAQRFPQADVLGLDLSERMVEEARAKTPPELANRVRFGTADAHRLAVPDASVDLVSLNNMIPFAEELARVTAPGGHVVIAFSSGAQTPIYVPGERLRRELERRGFEDVRELAAGPGTAVVARRRAAR